MAHVGIDVDGCISFDDLVIDLKTSVDHAQGKGGHITAATGLWKKVCIVFA
jgi:hypothetical protein